MNTANPAAEGGRSPHGERGLKFAGDVVEVTESASLSSWRAWIEIVTQTLITCQYGVALLMESVD